MLNRTKKSQHKSVLTHPSPEFKKLLEQYGGRLTLPQQIKMKIIWHHMQLLVLHIYADSNKNNRILQRFRKQWVTAEHEENKIVEEIRKLSGLS